MGSLLKFTTIPYLILREILLFGMVKHMWPPLQLNLVLPPSVDSIYWQLLSGDVDEPNNPPSDVPDDSIVDTEEVLNLGSNTESLFSYSFGPQAMLSLSGEEIVHITQPSRWSSQLVDYPPQRIKTRR